MVNVADVVIIKLVVVPKLVEVAIIGQPRCLCQQHHAFLLSDQPISQCSKPWSQSNLVKANEIVTVVKVVEVLKVLDVVVVLKVLTVVVMVCVKVVKRVGLVEVAVVGQPRRLCSQHHTLMFAVQAIKSRSQSKPAMVVHVSEVEVAVVDVVMEAEVVETAMVVEEVELVEVVAEEVELVDVVIVGDLIALAASARATATAF